MAATETVAFPISTKLFRLRYFVNALEGVFDEPADLQLTGMMRMVWGARASRLHWSVSRRPDLAAITHQLVWYYHIVEPSERRRWQQPRRSRSLFQLNCSDLGTS